MVRRISVSRAAIAISASFALAGCLGSNGGGGGGTGGGGGGGGGSYQAEFDRVSAIAPTTDMPTTLQANYAGRMRADVTDASEVVGQIVADLDLDVNWTDGQSTNPFSGTASNFQGRMAEGEFEAIEGTLSVDPSFGATITRTVIPSSTIAGITVPEVQTGAMSVTMTGQLAYGADAADATVLLGGNFHGAGASAAVGVVSGGFKDVSAPGPSVFDGGIGGTFYLERQ